ncbi:MAG: ABC transporter permease [Deltaproteobacteria bacterium]|nr:ABC transporter permease [Deltaproteobacteria bacterium]
MREPQVIIEPRRGLKWVDWKELVEYRDLFAFMVWRNIRTRYAQSALGVGWALIQPFFSMLVFTVIFGRLAKVDSNGVPYAIFSFTALVPWTYFANAVTESSSSLVANAHMLSKVYFPRVVLPLASVVARGVDFLIALAFLTVLMVWFGVYPSWNVLILPLLMAVLVLTASGLGLWFTALAIQYRDIAYAMNFIMQLLMYAAPVVYPTTLVPAAVQPWYALNPMVGVIEGFRSALLGTIPMPWEWIGTGALSALLLSVSGLVYFRSRERIFADVA